VTDDERRIRVPGFTTELPEICTVGTGGTTTLTPTVALAVREVPCEFTVHMNTNV
jgi:hypothetical protein